MERNRQLRAELRTLRREHHRLRERLRTLTEESAVGSEESSRQRELFQAALRVRKKAP
jgi:hypothetical protein